MITLQFRYPIIASQLHSPNRRENALEAILAIFQEGFAYEILRQPLLLFVTCSGWCFVVRLTSTCNFSFHNLRPPLFHRILCGLFSFGIFKMRLEILIAQILSFTIVWGVGSRSATIKRSHLHTGNHQSSIYGILS